MAALVWIHRWLGIATCLLFAMWFATGAVMVFVPFPSASAADKAAFAAPIDLPAVRIGPAAALAAAGVSDGDVRLIQRAGIPSYIVEAGGPAVAIDARDGARLPLLAPSAVGASASAHDYDQWTVPNGLDAFRPLYRIARDDAAGTVDYVSARTGELVQRTRASDRAWNWAGSVLHWIYFTPLRSDWALWDKVVWWLSLVASLVATAGVALGIVRSATSLRHRRGWSYFRPRWLRWHHLLGLFAGLFVLTWIVSGWLSMDHGRLFSRGEPTTVQARAFSGATDLGAVSVAALQKRQGATQLRFNSLAGEMIVAATTGKAVRRFDAAGAKLDDTAFYPLLTRAVEAAWPNSRLLTIGSVAADDIYKGNEGWPDTVLRLHLIGAETPELYVDSTDGRLLTVMDDSRAAYAWVYYGLHTFKVPGLVTYPVVRQGLVLALLAMGFAFSITGVVIAWRRLNGSRQIG